MASTFENVMNSPNVWTGKDGVKSVTDLLTNTPLQDKIQQGLMSTGYNKLLDAGTIKDMGASAISKLSGSVLSNPLGGAGAALSGLTSSGLLSGGAVEQAQKISQFKLASLIKSGKLSSTLNSATSASAVAQSKAALTSALSVASSLSGSLTGSGALSGALSKITGGASASLAKITGGASASLSKLASSATGDLGALVGNAGKFGAETATAWAKNTVSGVTGALSSLSGSLPSGASGAAALIASNPAVAAAAGTFAGISSAVNSFSNPASLLTNNPLIGASAAKLTGAIPGLSGLIAQKMDAFAGQNKFAVNFSDFKLPGLAAGVIPAAAYSGTIDRTTVDSATSRIIGSSKIASPVSGAAGPNSVTAQIDSLKQQIDTDVAALKDKAEAVTTKAEAYATLNLGIDQSLAWSKVRDKITDAAFSGGNLSAAQKQLEDLQNYISTASSKKHTYLDAMIAKLKQLNKAAAESAAAQNAAAAPSATDTSQQA